MASDDITNRDPDPLADSLRSDAPEGSLPGPTFVGFYTRSDRDDYGRLYFGRGTYIEFLLKHVVFHATVPGEQSPVYGEQATAIRFSRDAEIIYRKEPVSEQFTMDMRSHCLSEISASNYRGISSYFSCC